MDTTKELQNQINELKTILEHVIARIELEHSETGNMLLQGWLQDAKKFINKPYIVQ